MTKFQTGSIQSSSPNLGNGATTIPVLAARFKIQLPTTSNLSQKSATRGQPASKFPSHKPNRAGLIPLFSIMTYQTDQRTNASPIAIVSTAIASLLVGGVAGAHAGMSRNTVVVENAQVTAQQATQDYEACRAFVQSRDASIDQLNQHFQTFIHETRGQQQ